MYIRIELRKIEKKKGKDEKKIKKDKSIEKNIIEK